MSQFDLSIKNYDYNELLHIFKIEQTDNRKEVIYKLDKKMEQMSNGNFGENILIFFKKSRTIISTINELLSTGTLKYGEIDPFLNKIHKIDEKENIATFSNMDLLNKISNYDIDTAIANGSLNTMNKFENLINDKNTSNVVLNTALNEVSPGDLNSIKRITQLLNLNLNSCFRNNYYQSSPTDFLYNLPSEIKNVLALRLVSIELPNAWYLFSSIKKNNIFYICTNVDGVINEYKIIIPDGNYNYETLENYLNNTYFNESNIDYPLKNLTFSINPQNLKSVFENLDPNKSHFTIKFIQNGNSNENMMSTCGWILGYRFAVYNDITVLQSEGLFDAGGDRYVFLSINDYQYNNNTSNIVCFDKNMLNEDVIAKIPMINGKLSLVVNDNNNSLSKIRRYNGPINLSKFQVKLLDHFGAIIDLNNMDFSMTIELQILYENFNFTNVSA